MALFNRKPKTDAVDMPPELQNYYQAENREKTWMAWVLGLVTLVVTILLALALFFGGRWVYRKVTNDEPAKVTTTQTENTDQKGSENNSSDSEDSSKDTEEAAQPATPPATTQTPGTAAPATPPATATVPVTGDAGLPSTGPADTLAIFLAVSVLVYILHRRYTTA